jgi:hypothetical protein
MGARLSGGIASDLSDLIVPPGSHAGVRVSNAFALPVY